MDKVKFMLLVVKSRMKVLKHVVSKYYMFQYFNPALYNNNIKFNIFLTLKDFADQNPDLYFVNNCGLITQSMNFKTSREKLWMIEKTKETMLVGVYYLEDNQAYEGLF